MDETTAPIVAESAPESSSAPVTPSDRLARMSPVESAAWRKDGTVPGTEAPAVSSQADGDGGDGGEDHSAAPDPPAAPVTVDPAASAAGKALNRQKQTAQQRINDLARDKYRLEGELQALRSQQSSRPAAAGEVQPVAPPPAASRGLVEPQEEDFDTYRAFVNATADYRVHLALAADRQAREQQRQQAQDQTIASAADARIAAFAATHPDYLDVIRNQTEVYPSPLLADAVRHSDLTAELAYHLNTHVEEYRALVQLAPGPMLKALGKLEARLEAASPSASAPNPKPGPPPPPAPIAPIATGGSAATANADDLPFGRDYIAAQNRADAARGRRY